MKITTLEELEKLYWKNQNDEVNVDITNNGIVKVNGTFYTEFEIVKYENNMEKDIVYVKVANNNKIKEMYKEINNIKVIVPLDDEDDGIFEAECKLKEIVEKYGFEANTCDFDHYRIYNKGYEDTGKVWEIQYIDSLEHNVEENDDDTCTITIE